MSAETPSGAPCVSFTFRVTTAAYSVFGRRGVPWSGTSDSMCGGA